MIAGADQWSVDDIGWALAGAWLTDTTLIVEPTRISRSHTTAWPVVADHPDGAGLAAAARGVPPRAVLPRAERWQQAGRYPVAARSQPLTTDDPWSQSQLAASGWESAVTAPEQRKQRTPTSRCAHVGVVAEDSHQRCLQHR